MKIRIFKTVTLLIYLLLKKAKKSIKIFGGNLSKNIYDFKMITEAVDELPSNIKIEILLNEKEESKVFENINEVKIKKLNDYEYKSKVPGYFVIIDDVSFRFSKYTQDGKDNLRGTGNFNNPNVARSMSQVFDEIFNSV